MRRLRWGRRGKWLVAFSLFALTVILAGVFVQSIRHPLPPEAFRFLGNRGAVGGFAFTADSSRFLTVGNDRELHIWDIARRRKVRSVRLLMRPPIDMSFSPSREEMTTASADVPVQTWTLKTETPQHLSFSPPAVGVYVRYSPDGRYLATSNLRGGTVTLYDTETRQARWFVTGNRGYAGEIAFSQNGKWLASVDSGNLHLWDVETGRHLRAWKGLYPTFVAFSPDSRLLAFGGPYSELQLVEADSGRQRAKVNEQEIHRAVFSPDGRAVIVARDNDVLAYDLNGKLLKNLSPNFVPPGFLMRMFPPLRRLQRSAITTIGFSPDGRYFAYAYSETAVVQPTRTLALP